MATKLPSVFAPPPRKEASLDHWVGHFQTEKGQPMQSPPVGTTTSTPEEDDD